MKAAIFDMDGTLVDSMYYWRTVSLEFLRAKGIEPPRKLCDRAYLMSVRDAPELFRQYYEFPYTEEEYNDTVNSIMAKALRRRISGKDARAGCRLRACHRDVAAGSNAAAGKAGHT